MSLKIKWVESVDSLKDGKKPSSKASSRTSSRPSSPALLDVSGVIVDGVDSDVELAAARFEALGSAKRLSIYRVLVQAGKEGLPVGKIQQQLDIPASTLSHHLTKLIQTGLIKQTRVSRTLQCKADFDNMTQLISFLLEKCCVADDDCC